MTILQRAIASADTALSVERRFDAPVPVVYRLWTAPELLALWWGPHDFTTHSIVMDFRPGGTWSAVIRSPFGEDTVMSALYRDMVENSSISFALQNDEGEESEVAVAFQAVNGTTRLTVRQSPMAHPAEAEAFRDGWKEYLDRLESYLLRRHWGER